MYAEPTKSFVEQWLYGWGLDFSSSTVWKAKLEMFASSKLHIYEMY